MAGWMVHWKLRAGKKWLKCKECFCNHSVCEPPQLFQQKVIFPPGDHQTGTPAHYNFGFHHLVQENKQLFWQMGQFGRQMDWIWSKTVPGERPQWRGTQWLTMGTFSCDNTMDQKGFFLVVIYFLSKKTCFSGFCDPMGAIWPNTVSKSDRHAGVRLRITNPKLCKN